MRKYAFIAAALVALLVIPALAVFGPGSAPALAQGKQKSKPAATTEFGGVSGTVTSVQNGVLTVTTGQNRTVSLSLDAFSLVLKGGVASASALRAGDRVLVNPDFKAISNDNARARPATDPRDNKPAEKPSGGSAHPGNNGASEGATGPVGDRGARPSQQTNADNKGMPAGASGQQGAAGSPNAQSGAREGATGALAHARLVWVQQQGETLVYGLVRSVSGGTVVLKTGAQTQATVQVPASTTYARQVPEGAAGSRNAGRTELKQGAHVAVVVYGQTARAVLFVNPSADTGANSAKATK